MNKYNIKYTILSIVLLLFSLQLSAQSKHSNNWYFGYYAGISFNNDTVTVLENGKLNTREGCATISDKNGQLLFYTDGSFVFTSEHYTMPNGTGLGGDETSTQSSIIVPWPSNDSLYYIFTVDGPESYKGLGFSYSIVDMSLNNRLGVVTSKNIQLLPNPTEKVTSVLHQNKKDIWVIIHEYNTDGFYSYLVTESDISAPVISRIGTKHAGTWAFAGQMKTSQDGTKLALALEGIDIIEILDFDAATGVLSNPITINAGKNVYGVEFSPDNSKIYYSNFLSSSPNYQDIIIWQLDLAATDIKNSVQEVVKISSNNYFGALQLAPNGFIYAARIEGSFLSAITKPNELGIVCEFQDTAILLNGPVCKLGLPNFIQSSIVPPYVAEQDTPKASPCNLCDTLKIYHPDKLCVNEKIFFEPYTEVCTELPHFVWDFGDGSPATTNPSHKYAIAGEYEITLSTQRNKDCIPITIITIDEMNTLMKYLEAGVFSADTLNYVTLPAPGYEDVEDPENTIITTIKVIDCPEFDCITKEILDY